MRARPQLASELIVLAGVTALGGAIRVLPAVVAGFPMNDGGLFVAMIRAIQAGGPGLPEVVEYNDRALPFAYPPLALYLGAIVTGDGSPIATLRWLPVVFSLLTIPAAYAVVRQLLPTPWMAVVAATAFAVMPRSYNWMIGGGGVTRSLGFLLALIALAITIKAVRERSGGLALIGGAALGLSALSHPQAPIFALVSLVALVITNSAGMRRAWRSLVLVGFTAILVILPWFLLVVSRHGLSTLTSAAGTGGNLAGSAMMFLTFRFSDGPFVVLSLLGAFGLVVCLLHRIWLWPLWTALIFLVDSRAGLTYATIPVSGAVAYAIAEALRVFKSTVPLTMGDLRGRPRLILILGLLLVVAVADSLAAARVPESPLMALTPAQRSAMEWVRSNTPADARFLVVSGEPWWVDAVAEWFPVIAERRSSATVQGTEWQGSGQFSHMVQERSTLLGCASSSETDCARWWDQNIEDVDYVFAVDGDASRAGGHPCCLQIAKRAARAGGQVVLSDEGLLIVRMAP